MKRFNPSVSQLKAYGTDGELALSNAFKQEFPEADHHLCYIHLKRNMESKLTKLGIHGKDQFPFVHDVIGGKVEGTCFHGIVDCEDGNEFYAKLCSLEHIWNDQEKAITKREPVFYQWFVCNHADSIEASMLKPVRQRAGLEDSLFTTNDNEGINNLLKLTTGHTKLSLVELIEKVHQIVNQQDTLIEGAIIGQGDVRLTKPYAHLAVSPDSWRKMNPSARRKYLTKAKESGPLSSATVSLSVSAKTSGITGVPFTILENQFSKAGRLLRLNKVSAGFGAANSLLVASESSPKPHVITVCSNGKFACDDACPAYHHSNICSHTLAAAEFSGKTNEFLKWYNASGHSTSVTRMAEFGIDTRKSGRKPNEKWKGKKSKSSDAEFIVHHIDRISINPTILQHQQPSLQKPIKIKIVKKDGQHQVVSDENINKPFILTFLQDHPRVTTCSGCHSKFAKKGDGEPFPPPHDIIISHRECPTWRDKQNILRMGKEQAAYFHVSVACICKGNGKGNSDFDGSQLQIHPIVKLRLVTEHQDYLNKQLGISFN